MNKEQKLYGFIADMGLFYVVPFTFFGPGGLTRKQQSKYATKILRNIIKNRSLRIDAKRY